MPNNLRINTYPDQEHRLQQLLQTQADIQAEIASIVPSSAPATSYQHHRSPFGKHHYGRSINGPRNGVSSSGATMARQHSDRVAAPSMRSRTLSQRSAPAPSMARTNSRGASSARSGNVPFLNALALPQPFQPDPREDQDQNLAMNTWMNDNDDSYTRSHQLPPLRQSTSPRFELEQVPELGVGENPLQYLSRTIGTPTVAISPPFSTPPSTMSNIHLSNNSFNMPTPTTPTTDSLTDATTFPSNMSRRNSLCNERMLESLQMMHVNSNTSYSTDVNSDQFIYDQVNSSFPSPPTRRSSSEEQSQLLVGTGGVSHDSHFSHSFPSADGFPSVGYGEKMEKSQSSESSSSNASSASSRNKERLHMSVNDVRPLRPKGESAENILSRANSSKSMTRLESKDGSQDNKIAISKPSYQRPKHDRVHCKSCENHPDGFRGEHELRRHQDREHKTMVKKWVCIEPTGAGHPKPETPLSKCKACRTQKKYGAYYNAAAHLRRTHFRPKARGRGKNSKVDDLDKRGGKGGGDWPSMLELKNWMIEAEVPCDIYPSSTAPDDEAEAAEVSGNEQETSFDDPASLPTATNRQTDLYGISYLDDASPIINMSLANSNIYSAMPLDLTGADQGACQLDVSTMYGNADFQFSPTTTYSNDAAMTGFDFPSVPMINQGFDDSILNGSYF
ncbi:hypothetical protein BJ875DRAFT_380139 [Amylocarpus encephaloides]|uniref:DUF7896 domain-containing protein n=1 Tax=Amylocarpus encephaloides TaxID=45428 RepID=A0A9P8C423_9HELO|nr:hypothetical protein BJ875DRAFT_380139 [Amylocarpus encephaloides]